MKLKKNIALSDTGFVFDPSTGNSFTVNPIGLEIISYLKEGRSPEEIRQAVTAKYETDGPGFEKDFADFMNMLQKLKLTDGHGKATD
jgi:hypothetical protein